jgi:hypothetical protein
VKDSVTGEVVEIIPPMLFACDGDHAQIEALLDIIMRKYCDDHKIEFYKFPGGCSLIFQPADLMKSFQIMKRCLKSWKANTDSAYQDPTHLAVIKKVLVEEGMKGKSLSTYLNYFKHIIDIEVKAFNRENVRSGFEIAGIRLYSALKMFQGCHTFVNLSQENAEKVLAAIDDLQESAGQHCEVLDSAISNLVGDIVFTPIPNMNALTLTRCRGLWLNGRPIMEARLALKAEKERLLRVAAEKAIVDAENKAKRETATKLNDENNPGKAGTPSVDCYCSNPVCVCQFCATATATWSGCNFCELWFCPKKVCHTVFKLHRLVCHKKNATKLV